MIFKSSKIRWVMALSFALILTLAIIVMITSKTGIARADSSASGPTIASDLADYSPGSTVTLTGAGWAPNEAVHINVNDSVGNTWSLDSNPDLKADGSGGLMYQFSLPNYFVANYSVTATGPTSGMATTTFTDAPCPVGGTANRLPDNNVGAKFSISTVTNPNDTATYTFDSFVNENPDPSTGIPGLIDYCVYTTPLSTSHTTVAVGADGTAWDYFTNTDNFSFGRTKGGNPSNILLNGKTGTEIGTATWSGGVPTSQTIVLHVNDPAECSALYGSGTLTCFVLPGSPQQQAKDLTVSKTATPSFTRTFTWGLTKDVVGQPKVTDSRGSAPFNYSVSVTHDSGKDSGWNVTGTITVNNPNGFPVSEVNVTDDGVTNGGSCILTTNGTGLTVPANASVQVSYSCTYSSAPNPSNGTNKATAKWDGTKYNTPDNSASKSADFTFNDGSKGNPTVIDDSVTVIDSLADPSTLGMVSSTDKSPTTFTYSYTVTGTPGKCVTQDNTATFKTNSTGTTGSDSKTVTLCTPVDLTVKKDATPSFTRTYTWGITKNVDYTQLTDSSGKATFNYTVTVNETGFTDSGWQVNGTITVSNPNDFESITLTQVKDAIDNGGNCTVSGDTTAAIAASGSVTLPYSCTYASAPSPSSGTNTATASWDQAAASTPDGSVQGPAPYDFGKVSPNLVDDSVTVTDSLGGTLGTVKSTDSPKTFTYPYTITGTPGTCVKQDNTATFKTNSTGTTGEASQSVKMCTPVDLTVKKDATPSFTRTYTWGIKKSVDTVKQTIPAGGSATFSYTVDVNETGFTDSAWKVTGTITVSNPNSFEDIVANVSDAVDNGGGDICIVTGGSNVTVPHSGSVNLDYSCTYPSSGPAPSRGTNTATASWNQSAASTPDGSAHGTKTFDFATPTTTVNKTITVTDSYANTLGTLTATDSAPFASKSFSYQRTETGTAGTCTTYNNTATIKETGQTASASVQLCVAVDLTVSKVAIPSFTRTYTWGITKDVDQTKVTNSSGSATFNYTVAVTHDFKDSVWMVTGTITVSNPNHFESISKVQVTDTPDNGGTCAVDTSGFNGTLGPNESTDLSYTCNYPSSGPTSKSGTNTATVTWDQQAALTKDGSASKNVPFAFDTGDKANPTVIDDSVIVTDSLGGTLGTVKSGDPSPTSFTYSHTVTGTPGTCVTQDNTAMFTTNTYGTTSSASKSVQLCVGADLTVSKVAIPSFTRTYNWSIAKSVDKTLVEQIGGGSATFNYTVNVNETGFTDSNWQVTGKITITNSNDWEAITADVSDAINDGGICTVSGGKGVSVPASGSQTLDYTCTYASSPSPSSGTNTATASWDSAKFFTPHGSASGSANFAFGAPTKTVNQTITVNDTFNSVTTTLGTLKATDSTPFTWQAFTYSHTVNVPTFNCVKYTNIATIVETGQVSKTLTVEVCGPAKTGALTMGFWQNKNGQGIITGGASTASVCNSGTWLRQYTPFQDLSATSSCSQVATYVYNIIKAANASGSSMNAMLKAQMLATALDVYFSDPALGSNKIGAYNGLGNNQQPIGGVKIDLTMICKIADSSGTGSCSSSYYNVSSAFGIVPPTTSLTVSQILAYTASQSNAGGMMWYGNVKAMQEMAKDAFDAINNQVAFAP